MVSQVAFPYTFPFTFHTGGRVDDGMGSDSSGLAVDISRVKVMFPYDFPFYFSEGEYGVGSDNLVGMLAALLDEDSAVGDEGIGDRDFAANEAGLGIDIATLLAVLSSVDEGGGLDARVIGFLNMFLLQVYLPSRNLTARLGVRNA